MKLRKRSISLLLAVILTVACIPAVAFAATNGETVLSGVTFGGKEYKPDGSKVITVTVPNRTNSIELASALGVNNNLKAYSNYEFFEPSYAPATLEVGDDKSATMTVYYREGSNAPVYSTDYTIKLQKAAFVAPQFSGTVSKQTSVSAGNTKLSKADFEKLYKKNDGSELGKIRIIGSKPGVVTFKIGSNDLPSSGEVTAAQLDSLTIVPKAAGEANFAVKAFDASGAEVDGTGALEITVLQTTLLDATKAEITQLDTQKIANLGIAAAFQKVAGEALSKIKITSALSYGALVYDYVDDADYGKTLKKDEVISAADFARLTYLPNRSKLSKTVTESIKYTALDSTGNEYTGTIEIKISYEKMQLDELSAKIRVDEVVDFKDLDFAKVYNKEDVGTFSYVEFLLPPAETGELRYNYTSSKKKGEAVDEETSYYAEDTKEKLIEDICFVPAEDYAGTFYIYYTAYNTKDKGDMTGRIKVTVSSSSIGTFTDEVAADELYSFSELVTRINKAFKDLDETSGNFSYVNFPSLPDAKTEGTLYYDYSSSAEKDSAVATADKFYRSAGDKQLANVSFLPKADPDEEVEIKFNVYDSKGEDYSGKLILTIEESDYDIQTLTYTVDYGKVFKLSAADINKVVKEEADENFDYIYFDDLPASKEAGVYYNYTSEKDPGTVVRNRTSQTYYRTGSTKALVDDISVVPASGFSGVLELEYTAVVDKSEEYEGKIVINVKDGGGKLDIFEMKTDKNKAVNFSTLDFYNAVNKYSSDNLEYITFAIPSNKFGTLYVNYDETNGKYDSKVAAGDEFYRTSRSDDVISSVWFVPATDYYGSFVLNYTAVDGNDKEFSGTIKMIVNQTTPAPTEYTDVAKTSVYYNAIKWATEKEIAPGTSATTFSPNRAATRAEIVFFMWNAAGKPEPKSKTNPFTDVAATSEYYKAVLWASEQGITKGKTATTFEPNTTVNRGDAMCFMYRGKGSPTPQTIKNPFVDVPANAYFHHAVSWAYENKITSGTDEKHYSPKTGCTRAQIVTFLYNYYGANN